MGLVKDMGRDRERHVEEKKVETDSDKIADRQTEREVKGLEK